MYYTYIIKNIDNQELYIGYTSNLDERIRQHKSKNNIELIYYEVYLSEKDARERERKLKLYGSAWRGLKARLKDSLELAA